MVNFGKSEIASSTVRGASLEGSGIVPDKAPPAAHQTRLKYADNDPDAWNTLDLICSGMKIKTSINGRIISNFDATGVLDDDLHKVHNVGTTGKIALQLHKGDELLIRFKDIEIRQIKIPCTHHQ